jgi:hypothetical protein
MEIIISQNKAENEPSSFPMTHKEARECIDKINFNMSNIRYLLVELHDRKGWESLGYKDWTECVENEFKQGRSYIFYQFKAAQIERNISESTMVDLGKIPERQLRPLARLEPEQQKEAWQKAVETAPNGKVTADHVYKIVKGMQETEAPKGMEVNRSEPSDAMQFATIAISQLERIHPKDPEKERALCHVEEWIQKHKKRGRA